MKPADDIKRKSNVLDTSMKGGLEEAHRHLRDQVKGVTITIQKWRYSGDRAESITVVI